MKFYFLFIILLAQSCCLNKNKYDALPYYTWENVLREAESVQEEWFLIDLGNGKQIIAVRANYIKILIKNNNENIILDKGKQILVDYKNIFGYNSVLSSTERVVKTKDGTDEFLIHAVLDIGRIFKDNLRVESVIINSLFDSYMYHRDGKISALPTFAEYSEFKKNAFVKFQSTDYHEVTRAIAALSAIPKENLK